MDHLLHPVVSSLVLLFRQFAGIVVSWIMWLIVSSLSPHNPNLLFFCVLFSLKQSWPLMALFYAAMRRVLASFHTTSNWYFFLLELNGNKSPQVSRNILSILLVLDGLNSSSTKLFIEVLFRVLLDGSKALITISVTASFMFHRFSAIWQHLGICQDFRLLTLSLTNILDMTLNNLMVRFH